MSGWREELKSRLSALQLRPEREAEIVEELTQHLDDRVRDLVTGGMDEASARAAALADLDTPHLLAARLRQTESRAPLLTPPGAPSRAAALGTWWLDLRYSIRSLRRAPLFTITVVAALALTIGPATAIISVGSWLLWRPAPGVDNAASLAVVWFGQWNDDERVSPSGMSYLNLADLRAAATTFDAIAGVQEATGNVAAEGVSPAVRQIGWSTENLFAVLGVRMAAGRPFTVEDDQLPNGAQVAIVSHAFARSAFGSAAAAVGRQITLNGQPLSIVGVATPRFRGTEPTSNVDVWIPGATYGYVRHMTLDRMLARSNGLFYSFVIRVKPGVSFDAAQAELDVLTSQLTVRYPDENNKFTTVRPRLFPGLGADPLRRPSLRALVNRLMLVGGVLLLLGCANAANLTIFRAVRQQRDRAVRLALGASRARLLQLQLTESCLLALGGAAAGIVLAIWLKELIRTLLMPADANVGMVPLDWRVLSTTIGISMLCGVLAGIAPGLVNVSTVGWLGRSGARMASVTPRLRTSLAVVQLAFSLALVTGALLLVATVWNLRSTELGFEPRGVTVQYLSPGENGYRGERALEYNRQVLSAVSSSMPGDLVSVSQGHPFASVFFARLQAPGPEPIISAVVNGVTDAYFRVLSIPIVRGRSLTREEALASGGADGAPIVISQTLAQRLFNDAEPLGNRVVMARTVASPARELVVIGVAGDLRTALPEDRPDFTVYAALGSSIGMGAESTVLLTKSARGQQQVSAITGEAVVKVDPTLPAGQVRPLMTSIDRSLSDHRVLAWTLALLGGFGLLLATVGLYGLLAQTVTERTREFGIRMAIGATRSHIFGLVLRTAAWVAVLGTLTGLGLAAFGTRLIESRLVGVRPLEPSIFVAASILFASIVFLASVLPARTATRVQPIDTLRTE